MNLSRNTLFFGGAAIVVGGVYVLIRQKSSYSNKIPSKWQEVGELSELFLYPLKSGRGVELIEAECTELGLKTTPSSPAELQNLRDRFFLIYDGASSTFTTCRKYPSLLLVRTTSAEDGAIIFEAPGMPLLKLYTPQSPSQNERKKMTMWFGEQVHSVDCGDKAAEWISRYLKNENKSLRIGFYLPADASEKRNTDIPPWDKFKKYYRKMRNQYTGAYSDLASFMLINQSSVNDLKSKLPPHLQKMPAKQFRPNFVVQGCQPYTEDTWDWVKIGENVIMRSFKPCTRCTMTTMDPDTGIREPHMEPLRTLKAYMCYLKSSAKMKANLFSLPPTKDAALHHSCRVFLQVQQWFGNESLEPEC